MKRNKTVDEYATDSFVSRQEVEIGVIIDNIDQVKSEINNANNEIHTLRQETMNLENK